MENLKPLVSDDSRLTILTSNTQSSIPVDLVIEILSRLPLKSVARFRCLSKSWASILSRPYFTELFLTNFLNHPRLLFTAQVLGKTVFFSTPQTQNVDGNFSRVATLYQSYSSRIETTSSLYGLVCCQDLGCNNTKPPVICNPATGEFLTLPEAAKTRSRFPVCYCGYDPTDKIFKVLCISSYQSLVLTLETGKLLWRTIKCKTHYPIYPYGPIICIDGFLYYISQFDIQSTEYVVVCFDVRSEKLSCFSIYDDEIMERGSTLIKYKGRLGVVQFTDCIQRILCLWLLEDAAGTKKWSKYIYELPIWWKQKHNQPNIEFKIVGMTRTCDIVLSPYQFSDPFHVFYYNVERKTLSKIELQGLQDLKSHSPVVHIFQDYVEDLQLMKSLF